MGFTLLILLAVVITCAACESPETERTRGGGPGADVGNRSRFVQMHEGSRPFEKTPQIITTKHPSLATAHQADQLSRK
jgi:hypothetical protein